MCVKKAMVYFNFFRQFRIFLGLEAGTSLKNWNHVSSDWHTGIVCVGKMRGQDHYNMVKGDYTGTVSVSFGHWAGTERDHSGHLVYSPASTDDCLWSILGRWVSIWFESPLEKGIFLSVSKSNKFHHQKFFLLPPLNPSCFSPCPFPLDVMCGDTCTWSPSCPQPWRLVVRLLPFCYGTMFEAG